MIQNVQNAYATPSTARVNDFTKTDASYTQKTIPSTYLNDIQSMTSGEIRVEIIKTDNIEAIKKLYDEMGLNYTPDTNCEVKNFYGEEIRVYDLGNFAKEYGIPLTSSKIIGKEDPNGNCVFNCLLEGNRHFDFRLIGQPGDKTIDSSTMKNVVLKGMKMTIAAVDIKGQMSGASYDYFDGVLAFDPSTKKADFSGLKESLVERIKMGYNVLHEYSPITDKQNKVLDGYLAQFNEDFFKILDEMI